MEPVVVDCRTLPCPQPIIKLKNMFATELPASLLVIVDNDPAEENVNRFLKANGYEMDAGENPERWHIAARLGKETAARPAASESATRGSAGVATGNAAAPARTGGNAFKTLVLILAPVMGSGDDMLGGKLMKNFLATLPEFGEDLWRIILLNGGVKLSTGDSPVIGELQALETSGVSILVCGTCLEHFGLPSEKAVGQTTNMLDVVTSIQLAEKVIRV